MTKLSHLKSLRAGVLALCTAGAAAAVFAAPVPVFAQSSDEAGETQLDMSIEQLLKKYDITTEVQTLTNEQLSEIRAIDAEHDNGRNTKQRIEAVINR